VLKRTSDIVIFGDGPVGYLTALVIHKIFNFDSSQIFVVGMDNLAKFDFAQTIRFEDINKLQARPDFVFECVGGPASEGVINKAISMINPAGKIVLMGVSENYIPVNTRDVLEKGITIIGSSRSSRYDYVDIYNLLKNKDIQALLKRLIIGDKFEVTTPEEMRAAFEFTANKKVWGKVLLNLNIK